MKTNWQERRVSPRLSKSKYLTGLQCPKLLWVQFHEPKKILEPDPITQYFFKQGHLIGELAKKSLPGGIDVPTDDFMDNIRQTEQLLQERIPLFEAGLLSEGTCSRIDILNPVGEDEWDIIEVKSSTSVKDQHFDDLSFQKYCCEKVGLKTRKCFLMHLDSHYIRYGEIDPEKLFVLQDVSVEVEEAIRGMQDRIRSMFETVSASKCPDVTIGRHCSDPYECPITECWDSLPEGHVFTLYSGGGRCDELFNQGILTIKDIPDNYRLSLAQQIQKECEVTGQPHVNREGIADFLGTLRYPLYYLDFETIGPAVPIFDGTRPYQDIPFQFSLHIVQKVEAGPEHFSFLASGADDPRLALLSELKKLLGYSGSIIVYNQGFEEGILKESENAFPEYSSWVSMVCGRLIDLLKPFRKFHYYHPMQRGSASLKSVLPALTGRSHEGMDIANGMAASIAFQAVTYGDVPRETRDKVRADLEKYCSLDTEGMILIVERLRALSA